MLKGIPAILSPELLKRLCEMGHSDKLLIADGNFPTHTVGADSHIVRMDGHGVGEILDAVLQLFPLIPGKMQSEALNALLFMKRQRSPT